MVQRRDQSGLNTYWVAIAVPNRSICKNFDEFVVGLFQKFVLNSMSLLRNARAISALRNIPEEQIRGNLEHTVHSNFSLRLLPRNSAAIDKSHCRPTLERAKMSWIRKRQLLNASRYIAY